MRTLFASVMILFTCSLSLQAQQEQEKIGPEKTFSLRVDRQSTGSGHLNFTTIGASYKIGRSSLYAGALLEDRNKSFQGVKGNYRFYPIAFGQSIRPYLQYQFIGRWGSRLTDDMERLVHREGWDGARSERYRTFEHYIGFGADLPLIAGASADIGIGLGLYHSRMTSSFDERIEDPQRFRSDLDASLSLNAGLGYAF